jgi:RES domain-containing protein
MRLWRISNHADLSGEGGRLVDGRWHPRGLPVVYLAEHPALALLEHLVHLEIDLADLPDGYQLLEVELPDDLAIERITAEGLIALDPEWPRNAQLTQRLGGDWLRSRRSPLLGVPSVILPRSTNFLLNPSHLDASRAAIASATRPPYDHRLFG